MSNSLKMKSKELNWKRNNVISKWKDLKWVEAPGLLQPLPKLPCQWWPRTSDLLKFRHLQHHQQGKLGLESAEPHLHPVPVGVDLQVPIKTIWAIYGPFWQFMTFLTDFWKSFWYLFTFWFWREKKLRISFPGYFTITFGFCVKREITLFEIKMPEAKRRRVSGKFSND